MGQGIGEANPIGAVVIGAETSNVLTNEGLVHGEDNYSTEVSVHFVDRLLDCCNDEEDAELPPPLEI